MKIHALLAATVLSLPVQADVRRFDGVDDYLYTDFPPTTGPTFSASFWFVADADRRTRQVLWTALRSTTFQRDDAYRVSLETDGTLRYFARDHPEDQAIASIRGVKPGVLYFCCVTATETTRTAYLSCEPGMVYCATSTGSVIPQGIDRMSVGRAADSAPPHAFFCGTISCLTVWDGVALGPADVIRAMQAGSSAPSVWSDNIAGHWPIDGSSPEPDAVGGNDLRVVE